MGRGHAFSAGALQPNGAATLGITQILAPKRDDAAVLIFAQASGTIAVAAARPADQVAEAQQRRCPCNERQAKSNKQQKQA